MAGFSLKSAGGKQWLRNLASYKVNEEVMNEWIAALRSGDYEQTQSTLRAHPNREDIPQGYCCLGVAVQMAINTGDFGDWVEEDGSTINSKKTMYSHDNCFGGPSERVERRIFEGINKADAYPSPWAVVTDHYGGELRVVGVATLNDSHGSTFEEIADMLEETWIERKYFQELDTEGQNAENG